MSEFKIAAKMPVVVTAEAGRTYAWCRCGLSTAQPFCDGAHKITDLRPLVWQATESKEVWLCQCKQTKNAPFCDGSHQRLDTPTA